MGMNRQWYILAVPITAGALLFGFLLTACTPGAAATPIEGLQETLAMRTLVAEKGMSLFMTATPVPPTPVPGEQSSMAIFSLPPTETPVPALTPMRSSAYGASYKAKGCFNQAEFVKDISVPDDTQMQAGQHFTKTWQFRNSGSCIWSPEYAVAFLWGDLMEATSPIYLGKEVKPRDTIDISIPLVAPKGNSIFQGNWIFVDDLGDRFGTGGNARNFFWVSIIVGNPNGGGGGGGGIFGCGGGG
jgi:hypothetical protein